MGESFSFVLSSPQTLNSPPQPHPLHHHHLHPQYRQLSRSQVSTQQINSPTVKMFVKSTVAVALFASFVAAQSTTSNSSIDANSIDPTTRSQWCLGQRNTCGTLCSGDLPNKVSFTTRTPCQPSSARRSTRTVRRPMSAFRLLRHNVMQLRRQTVVISILPTSLPPLSAQPQLPPPAQPVLL